MMHSWIFPFALHRGKWSRSVVITGVMLLTWLLGLVTYAVWF